MRRAACVGVLVAMACGSAGPPQAASNASDPQPVPAVAGLGAHPAADAVRVDLSWQAAGPGLSYVVLRTDHAPSTLAVIEGTSYSVITVTAGEKACFAVQARAGTRTGPLSDAVCAFALDVPRQPAPVSAFSIPGGVRVVWNAASDGDAATGWIVAVEGIERELAAGARSLEVTGLGEGTWIHFLVSARNGAGRSKPSSAAAVAGRPATPTPPMWAAGPRVPVLAVGATVALGRLWVIGTDATTGDHLVSAVLGADGMPSVWEDSKLPAFAHAPVYTGWADGDRAFLVGAGNLCCGLGTEATGNVLAFELHQDGTASSAGPQERIGPVPANRPGVAVVGAHLFSIGGFWWSGGSFTGYGTGLPFVYVGDFSADGRVASWRRTAALPKAANMVQATSFAGRVYAVFRDAESVLRAAYAQPEADGSITRWRAVNAPGADANALFATAGRLYALGEDQGALYVGSTGAEGDVSWSTTDAEAVGQSVVPPVLAGEGHRLYVMRQESAGNSSVVVANIDPATGHVSASPPDQPAPGSVRAVSSAAGSVSLAWDAVQGADSYEVRRMGDARSTATAAPAATVTGLDPLLPVRFEVRSLGAGEQSGWTPSDVVIPWPSSTWRPSGSLGCFRSYALFAGNTLFATAYPSSFTAPLDGEGLPWAAIGLGGSTGVVRPRHLNEAAAAVPLSSSAACLVLTGGRDYLDDPPGSKVGIGCAEDDGFTGRLVDTGPTDPLPLGRIDHAAAAADNRIFVLGGSIADGHGALSATADVSVATVGTDLSVSGWRSTSPLPGTAATLAATAARGRLYAIAPSFAPDQVLVADIAASGSLGAWRESGTMPFPRTAPSAIVVRDVLYVLGGGAEGTPTVLIGKLDAATGAIAGWSADPSESFVGQRANPSALVRGDRLYVFGNWALGSTTCALQTADIDVATGRLKRWR
jgi:hypothetical protein